MGELKTIVIDVNEKTGSISITPTSLQMTTDDWIVWKLAGPEDAPLRFRDVPLLVTFEDGDAFVIGAEATRPKESLHSVLVRQGQYAFASGKRKGIFQYKVAVFVGGNIHAVMNCPEVIIK